MNKDYLHHNGNIINGNWESIDNPEFISPRINGKIYLITLSQL